MFVGIGCTIPLHMERRADRSNDQFIQTVMEEDYRVKELHKQEIQSTAENPRIRDQNEITDISIELRAQKYEDLLEKKRRQQLRQNNMELRQLDLQLRTAIVSKQIVDQKLEVDKQKEAEAKKKRSENEAFEKERLRCEELFHEAEIKERQKKQEFRNVLLGQMSETTERRKKEYEEILKDREEMNKLLERHKKEEEKERQDLERRKDCVKKEMEDFIRVQLELKQKKTSDDKDELESFLRMMKERDEQNRIILEERQKQTAQREELSNRIGLQLWNVTNEKRHRENLLLDLLVEESNTKEDERFRQNLEKQELTRMQMRMEFDRYLHEVERKKLEGSTKETTSLDYFVKYNQEQIEKEREAAETKRKLKIEHGRAIKEMIESKRLQRAKDLADELKMHELFRKQELEQEEMVEKERLRMLCQAPPEILRYLPAGVIRDSDRKILGLPIKEKK